MNYQQLQDEIVSSFWSKGLKEEIAKRGYVFPPMDLMAVVYQHTGEYEQRLALLELFADHVPEIADYAKQIIAWERSKLERIKTHQPSMVYELRLSDEDPTQWDDFLCADFDSCLAAIDAYYKHYHWLQETPQTRYSIVCRKLLGPGDDLSAEVLGSCDLLPGKIIERVYLGQPGEYEDCNGICFECPHDCIVNQEPVFPAFLPDKSPVCYRLPDGSVHYGLTLADMSDISLCYIIPLDGEMLEKRDYGQFCVSHEHEHIPCPDVDSVRREDLPEHLRENYDAFLAFLNKEETP